MIPGDTEETVDETDTELRRKKKKGGQSRQIYRLVMTHWYFNKAHIIALLSQAFSTKLSLLFTHISTSVNHKSVVDIVCSTFHTQLLVVSYEPVSCLLVDLMMTKH